MMGEGFNSSVPLFIVVLAGTAEEGCLDYADPAVPATLLDMKAALENSGVISDTFSFWYADLLSWIVFLSSHSSEFKNNGNVVPPSKLIPWLNEFLSSAGATHMMTLHRAANSNSTRFSASLMMGSLVPLDGLRLILDAIYKVEGVMRPFTLNGNVSCAQIVPYSPVFFALGQVDTFQVDAFRVVGASLIVVLLMTLIFAHNVVLAVFVTLAVGLLAVSIFALHAMLGLQLNGITIVNIALGFTLAAEYMSYYVRAYISQHSVRANEDAAISYVEFPHGRFLFFNVHTCFFQVQSACRLDCRSRQSRRCL